jgi:hypothetical protein
LLLLILQLLFVNVLLKLYFTSLDQINALLGLSFVEKDLATFELESLGGLYQLSECSPTQVGYLVHFAKEIYLVLEKAPLLSFVVAIEESG